MKVGTLEPEAVEEGGILEPKSVEEVGMSKPEAVEEMAAIDKDQKKLASALTSSDTMKVFGIEVERLLTYYKRC
jgi:hypothetical protein